MNRMPATRKIQTCPGRLVSSRRMHPITAVTASILLFSVPAIALEFSLDWWSIDGGGEVLAETADQQWQLSGTLGQWDSTGPTGNQGAGWTLTGGFWLKVDAVKSELIFRDGFEAAD